MYKIPDPKAYSAEQLKAEEDFLFYGSFDLYDPSSKAPQGDFLYIPAVSGVNRIVNVCPHHGAALVKEFEPAEIDDNQIRCPWHGKKFDIENGIAINSLTPCPGLKIQKFKVVEGVPGLLSQGVLPEPLTQALGESGWRVVTQRIVTSCSNWKMHVETFSENLHIPFIHESLKGEVNLSSYKVTPFSWGQMQTVESKESSYYGTSAGGLGYWFILGMNMMIEIVGNTMVISQSLPDYGTSAPEKFSKVKVQFYERLGSSISPTFVGDFMTTFMEDDALSCSRQSSLNRLTRHGVDLSDTYSKLEEGTKHYREFYNSWSRF